MKAESGQQSFKYSEEEGLDGKWTCYLYFCVSIKYLVVFLGGIRENVQKEAVLPLAPHRIS